MAVVRMLVGWNAPTAPPKYVFTNTLYFNVTGSIDDPDYQNLADDLWAIYSARSFTNGRKVEVRAYDMDDPKPRPERAYATGAVVGSMAPAAPQIALCLSYYADRNLPRQRGRIYAGPYQQTTERPSSGQMAELITLGQALAGLGGLNVDWSVHSVMNNSYTRISNIWVDNSFDVIRSRKIDSSTRSEATING